MLILITNSCHMGCKHCMQNAVPCEEHMDFETFQRTVAFAKFLRVPQIALSGGEPTEHPELLRFCKYLDKCKMPFSIVSNGEWYKDEKKVEEIKQVMVLRHCMPMQVYTNEMYYPHYYETVEHFIKNKYHKVLLDTSEIRSMQDLGRAHKNCQQEVKENPYYMSCLVPTLHAHQSRNWQEFTKNLLLNKMFCKPMVDVDGDIHLSESRLCPSYGNVFDPWIEVWRKVSKAVPCGKCALCKKFYTAMDQKAMMCRMKIYGNPMPKEV